MKPFGDIHFLAQFEEAICGIWGRVAFGDVAFGDVPVFARYVAFGDVPVFARLAFGDVPVFARYD